MTLPLAIEMTPEEREQLARAMGRILGLVMRNLDLPWWAATLVLLAVAALAATVLAYTDRTIRRARKRRRSRP